MFDRRLFSPKKTWVYRTDIEFSDNQLVRYRVARTVTILFALFTFSLMLFWLLSDSRWREMTREQIVYCTGILIYCFTALYPNRWIKSNRSFTFKCTLLECGVIWMLAWLGNGLISESWTWSQLLFAGLIVLMTWLTWLVTKSRFEDRY
jgi:anaerobic C4-dicarboxylate transporter